MDELYKIVRYIISIADLCNTHVWKYNKYLLYRAGMSRSNEHEFQKSYEHKVVQ